MIQPQFTAAEIFDIHDRRSFAIVRELGFANLSMELLGIRSLFVPAGSFQPPSLVARIMGAPEHVAMISDGFVLLVLLIFLGTLCIAKEVMQRLAEICLLAVLCGSVASSQTAPVPPQRTGIWTLSLQESRMPAGVLGEAVVIASTPGHLKIGSDVVTSERGSSREELDLDTDGKETVFPEGPRLSFKRSDDTTFDVIISSTTRSSGTTSKDSISFFPLTATG